MSRKVAKTGCTVLFTDEIHQFSQIFAFCCERGRGKLGASGLGVSWSASGRGEVTGAFRFFLGLHKHLLQAGGFELLELGELDGVLGDQRVEGAEVVADFLLFFWHRNNNGNFS